MRALIAVVVSLGMASTAFAGAKAGANGKRTYFIESHDVRGLPGEIDLQITGHGLGSPKLAALAAQGKVSKQRYIEIENPVLYGGHGEGKVAIGGRDYQITYAWQGRGNSFTVRLKPADGGASVSEVHHLLDDIRRDESVPKERTIVIPRRDYLRRFGVKDNKLSTARTAIRSSLERVFGGNKDINIEKATEMQIAELKGKKHISIVQMVPFVDIRPEEL